MTKIVHVIDDDPAVLTGIILLLESVEIDVAGHSSAVAFLSAFDPQSTACIVTDVDMPMMSGLDLVAELRQRGINRPVVAITGHSSVERAQRAAELGIRAPAARDESFWRRAELMRL